MNSRRLILSLLVLGALLLPAATVVSKGRDPAARLVALATKRMMNDIHGVYFSIQAPVVRQRGLPTIKGLRALGALWGKQVLSAQPGRCGSHFAMAVQITAPIPLAVDESALVGRSVVQWYVRTIVSKQHAGKWKRFLFRSKTGPNAPARYRYAWIAAAEALNAACFSPAWLKWRWTTVAAAKLRGVPLLRVRGVGDVGSAELIIGAVDHYIYYEQRHSNHGDAIVEFTRFNLSMPTTIPPH
jgi:hypothetical protein